MDVESHGAVGKTLKILIDCNKSGEVLSKHATPSIYMVPSLVRDLSPTSYSPRVVAIGPLHKQDEHLQEFEVQKTAYLHNWLQKIKMAPEQMLQKYTKKVIDSMKDIKACYEGPTTYADFELAKMMVIDACFILEFIRSLEEGKPIGTKTNILITQSIILDMFLIENQIPFFVLEIIWECSEEGSLTKHINVILNNLFFIEANVVVPDASDPAPAHILGLFQKYFAPAAPMSLVCYSIRKLRPQYTALELDRAGMNFKPNTEDQKWALAMKLEPPIPLFPRFHIFMAIPPFSWFQRPTLRMPKMNIGDDSEIKLRNLVVYEQSLAPAERYVTSYLSVLDMLIDTPDDVAVLVKSKVLHHILGSNEEVANMINNLCNNIGLKFFYDSQWAEMDDYYNSYWPHTLAGLKRRYFNNPWSIIALIAAFILFALTVVQTIFTIKGPV